MRRNQTRIYHFLPNVLIPFFFLDGFCLCNIYLFPDPFKVTQYIFTSLFYSRSRDIYLSPVCSLRMTFINWRSCSNLCWPLLYKLPFRGLFAQLWLCFYWTTSKLSKPILSNVGIKIIIWLNYIIIPQTTIVCPGSIPLLRVVIRHSELSFFVNPISTVDCNRPLGS